MGKHFLIWLMILIFTPLALPVLLSPKTISVYIRKDYKTAIAILGEKESINQELISLYKKNLTVFAKFANEFRDKHDDSDKYRNSGDHIGEAIADIPGDWAASVKLQAYSMALRLVILSRWGLWLVIPVVMGFIAGVFERRLKSDTFSPPLPPVYNTSTHMLLALGSLLLLWLICPIPIPLLTIPMASVLMSVFISLAIAHYPKY
jgi:1,4-dihydroxy-2-naphthoate octaprenyltransferase